ncbi:heterogeneous nuclear ribonucleoprotein A1, A2/B1 homolog [Homalodisca vitripennis]|uniref:heterogeneous nuclear ribonucleoprotein A1, A2/B1 homolog n=1 Tax=Homalodisca vitripennis TaxID=197043 RepID=UPI001EEC02B6|nr:heterogeneous nuclear ribonucleoprotein A1, A2/B1 homolog [Homalodisca vitripennis]
MSSSEKSNENREPEQLRKLFIGGLDYRTTDESLKEFFLKWGEIVDVVVMKDPNTKRSRGFGFITYARSNMVDDAMAKRPHVVNGRQVETKRAIPRTEIGNPEAEASVKKLFIGGLKETINEDDLKKYFEEFGNIINISVPVNKENGSKRGFAFIEFDDYDPVDKVILQRSHVIKGKSVDVRKALSKEIISRVKGGYQYPGIQFLAAGGNGYGANPWDAPGDNQVWSGPSQQWGMNQNQEGNYGHGWGAQENFTGGPMRNNMYSGQNRSAPYGMGTGGPSGPYGGSGGSNRRY